MGFSPFSMRPGSKLTGALCHGLLAAAVAMTTGCGGNSNSNSNNQAPTITSFMATPAVIPPGGTAILTGLWPLLLTGVAPTGVITPGNYNVLSGTPVPVSPLVTTTYTLTVNNTTGTIVTTTATVTVSGVASPTLNVVAGQPSGAGMVNGVASAAKFTFPCGVAVDGLGNTYVADTDNSVIRIINASGVATFAGNPGHPGSANGTGKAASFNQPSGLAVDGSNNVYVADTGNSTIRFITPAGAVTTLAGTAGSVGSVNGPAAGATFNHPYALTVAASGNVYVADTGNHALRLLTPGGVVSTLAGTVSIPGAVDGPAVSASFNQPQGVAVDGSGNVYVADTGNNTLRMITAAGIVSTPAGKAGSAGHSDGTGVAARFDAPTGLTATAAGIVYVADSGNQTIRKVVTGGVVTTLAGTAGTFGSVNALGTAASFYNPHGLALDGSANLYVADASNNLIRLISPVAQVSNLAGVQGLPGWVEGTGITVRFNNPTGVAVDEVGNAYVAEAGDNVIRKISAAGISSTVAGTALVTGAANGAGSAASFYQPVDVAVSGGGDLYVVDAGNQLIRMISAAGVVSNLAGTVGAAGYLDGPGNTARFSSPSALALDPLSNVYVADTGNGLIRLISTAGNVTTVGSGFSNLQGVAVDAAGNIYAADAATHAVYILAPSKAMAVLAGIPGTAGSLDGAGATATFNHPTRLCLDGAGNLYVTDANNDTIRKIVLATGVVSTVVGIAGTDSILLGNLPGALADPSGIACDPLTGQLYICVPDTILAASF